MAGCLARPGFEPRSLAGACTPELARGGRGGAGLGAVSGGVAPQPRGGQVPARTRQRNHSQVSTPAPRPAPGPSVSCRRRAGPRSALDQRYLASPAPPRLLALNPSLPRTAAPKCRWAGWGGEGWHSNYPRNAGGRAGPWSDYGGSRVFTPICRRSGLKGAGRGGASRRSGSVPGSLGAVVGDAAR